MNAKVSRLIVGYTDHVIVLLVKRSIVIHSPKIKIEQKYVEIVKSLYLSFFDRSSLFFVFSSILLVSL